MTDTDVTENDRRSSTTSVHTSRRRFLATAGVAAFGITGIGVATSQSNQATTRQFTVRIENVSDGGTLDTTDGSKPVPLSPGAYAVHTADEPIFSRDRPERNNGLEEIAEDGKPMRLAQTFSDRDTVVSSGVFTTPVGADSAGPIFPGDAYEFEIEASDGRPTHYLSLVTMFIQSNDLFYALGGPDGMRLFRETGSAPTTGDVTDHIGLWDAGTETNQEPGVGTDQAPRQRATNIGNVERETVVPIDEINGYDYPAVEDVIRVRLRP
ncbi:MAG: spondin domain-containing protein [Halobacteriales archaeon]|nr:spondin domain-containing protein [Halobacteriales archaeon]